MHSPIRTLLLVVALAGGLVAPAAAGAQSATEEGDHSANIRHVKNLAHQTEVDGELQDVVGLGSDIEFMTLTRRGREREFALAGAYDVGLQIYDISDPEQTFHVSRYDCVANQGDVQVFERGRRTYVTYTTEDTSPATGRCVEETTGSSEPATGTFIIDVTNPVRPFGRAFIPVPEGSHNGTVHPSGDFFYNSNSDLSGEDTVFDGEDSLPGIEIYDISDFDAIKRVGVLPLPVRPGLGTDSHDITFNAAGDRAYSAALSQTVILNTGNPANPSIVSSFVDPAINVEHQADPFTITNADGVQREFLIIEDEFVGALPTGQCPNGGVHVYDITGALEANPIKVGYWNVAEVRPATNEVSGGLVGEPSNISRCTAHVFDIHEEEQIMTIAFYNAGVRVVDLSGLGDLGVGLGTQGIGDAMVELAHYQFPDSDTWAVKTPHIEEDGSFYLYGNDQARGLDVYEYDPAMGAPSEDGGEFMSPADALALLGGANTGLPAGYTPFCLLP